MFLIISISIAQMASGFLAFADQPVDIQVVVNKQASVDQFEPIPFEWAEINPNAPGGLPGIQIRYYVDPVGGPFDLGFGFPFYDCDVFNSIYVCINGFAAFSYPSGGLFTNQPIPTASEPNNLLAIHWDDMYLFPSGSIWYYPDSANSRFMVEWYQVQHYGTGGNYTFEMILYPDGTIDYQYHTIQHGTPNSCTIGIENSTGTEGHQATYNGSGPFESLSETAIRFLPVCVEPVDDLVISLSSGADFDHVVLTWSSAQGAQQYHIYKSITSPQNGFVMIDSTTNTTYTDPDAITGETKSFYYVTSDITASDASTTGF